MSFEELLKKRFPGALPEDQFVRRSAARLISDYGLTADNTLACVGVCRDELCRPLTEKIRLMWGEAFNMSSMAGRPTLGRSGLATAHSHAPIINGRSRFAFFVLPHIGLGPAGEPGLCQRPGRQEPSLACGALDAVRQDIRAGRTASPLTSADIEQSLLKQRLLRESDLTAETDLVDLTKLTHRVALADLEHLLMGELDPTRDDYVVISGIQIHGPAGADLVWPGASYVVIAGRRSEIWF